MPGYGSQGGSAADVAGAFRADGTGAIVNSSRGIISAFRPDEASWPEAIVERDAGRHRRPGRPHANGQPAFWQAGKLRQADAVLPLAPWASPTNRAEFD